jgi:undecaprenyl-diphosphatase
MLENLKFDQNLLLAINHINNPVLNFIFPLVSLIGSIYGTVIIVAVLWIKNPKLGVLLVISLLINQAVTYGLKAVIDRPRPSLELSDLNLLGYEQATGEQTEGSIPSGHTNRIFTVSTVTSGLMGNAILWFPLAVVVGFSMVYIGAHYPLDVLTGGLLAIVLSYIVLKQQKKFVKLIGLSEKIHKMIFGRFKKNVPLS